MSVQIFRIFLLPLIAMTLLFVKVCLCKIVTGLTSVGGAKNVICKLRSAG